MKRVSKLLSTLLSTVIVVSMIPLASNVNAAGIEINSGNFPDANFRTTVFNSFDVNKNWILEESEVAAAKSLIVSEIVDNITGVQHLTNLESLMVESNNLSSVDLSRNTKLKDVRFSHNRLTSLNVSNNTLLEHLECDYNSISSLDLSHNPNLNYLDCGDNNLTSLDISHNTRLRNLSIQRNEIPNIDFSNNSAIARLAINCNPFTSLDISVFDDLVALSVVGTNITSLDIRGNSTLIYCYQTYPLDDSNFIIDHSNVRHYALAYYSEDDKLGIAIDENVHLIVTDADVPSNPSVTPSVRPTNNPTTTVPTQTPTSESGVGGFVERLYTIALNRPSDSNGKADWVNRVYTQGATGADIARGFLFSPEFLGKDMSNDAFLDVLYRVFFDRAGDQGGITYWLEQMFNGMDKQNVIWGFINSTEWANVCLRYGIASGGNGVPNITIEPSGEIIAFATRLYTTCLCRNADSTGLMDWATRLANRQISGSDAAAGFFFSLEFINDSSIDNAEYINRLYQTFMNRPADQGGFDDWMNRMNNGASRQDVFNGFAGSQEWAGICSSYGILK